MLSNVTNKHLNYFIHLPNLNGIIQHLVYKVRLSVDLMP